MNRVTITVHIDLPDGALPDVGYSEGIPAAVAEVLQTFDEPLPEAPFTPRVLDSMSTSPVCPDHHKPMTFRPAGTSKRTGKPYNAFYGCPERDCKRTQNAA